MERIWRCFLDFAARAVASSPSGMKRTLAADGVDDDRRIPGRAEEIHGHVDVADAHHAAHPQAVIRKSRGIGLQRRVAVDAGREIAEMRRRQFRAREPLEIEHVERLVGRGDEFVRILAVGTHRGTEPRKRGRREHGLDDASPRQRAVVHCVDPPADVDVTSARPGHPAGWAVRSSSKKTPSQGVKTWSASITSSRLPNAVQGAPSQEISTIVSWSRPSNASGSRAAG